MYGSEQDAALLIGKWRLILPVWLHFEPCSAHQQKYRFSRSCIVPLTGVGTAVSEICYATSFTTVVVGTNHHRFVRCCIHPYAGGLRRTGTVGVSLSARLRLRSATPRADTSDAEVLVRDHYGFTAHLAGDRRARPQLPQPERS